MLRSPKLREAAGPVGPVSPLLLLGAEAVRPGTDCEDLQGEPLGHRDHAVRAMGGFPAGISNGFCSAFDSNVEMM